MNIPDKIPNGTPSQKFEGAILLSDSKKKKIAKGFLNYAGLFVGVFLLFAVVVVLTTDISLHSFFDVAALGLSFFVLLFCSYAMYVNCADSGMRAGLNSDIYLETSGEYDRLKKYIIDAKMQVRIPEFCRFYTEEELQNTRSTILAEVGILYDTYCDKYLGKDAKTIQHDKSLSKVQQNAIIKANKTSPVHLAAEMIFKRGRGSSRRAPLGTKPETKKGINFGLKFVRTCFTSVMMAIIVLDVVIEPTWAMFAAIVLKLLSVILNGFFGYKFGYENIVFDTVNYMNDQKDLMQQVIQYVENHPVQKPELPEASAGTVPQENK